MSRPGDLRSLFIRLDASAPQHLRDVRIRDQAGREAIASELLHYGDQRAVPRRSRSPEWRLSLTLAAFIDARFLAESN
jgi:hypothetical protein